MSEASSVAPQPILLITTACCAILYALGSLVSCLQSRRRKVLHQRNKKELAAIFEVTIALYNFPLIVSWAMAFRVAFFLVSYSYVSSAVDWVGLIVINILEGLGYLLFVSSFTIVVAFFGALPLGVSPASTHTAQTTAGTSAAKGEKNMSFSLSCLAFTANFWLYFAEMIFFLVMITSAEESLGTVEMTRKITFSIFYLFYIANLVHRFWRIKHALRRMHANVSTLRHGVAASIATCCLSLLLQIVSMTVRGLLTQTVGVQTNVFTNITVYNVSTLGDSSASTGTANEGFSITSISSVEIVGGLQTGSGWKETTTAPGPSYTVYDNRTAIQDTMQYLYTNELRTFEWGPVVFFFVGEWIPAMYLLYLMRPNGGDKLSEEVDLALWKAEYQVTPKEIELAGLKKDETVVWI